MSQPERARSVFEILGRFEGLDELKQLLWSELNYERANTPLSRRGWTNKAAAQCLEEDPVLFAVAGVDGTFHIVYARLASEQLSRTSERLAMMQLLKDHPYSLFIFSNRDRSQWHFINARYDDKDSTLRVFRRITVGPTERLRTASERIALLDVASLSETGVDPSPLAIQEAHDKAFDVEAVTEKFFSDYKSLYLELEDDLTCQTADRVWAHDYALQLLNRLMFLCFVQRKGWLGPEPEFLRLYWDTYRETHQPPDSFFRGWLEVLFFEALNNKFSDDHRYLPESVTGILRNAPYLNGGLFAKNKLDEKPGFAITDECVERILGFLEAYNFTIAEDSPFEQEVAVDPEMIGKVYESLVNVSEEIDERSEAGIFYTERTEIEIMCRLALVDYMANHLGPESKDILYEVIFALDPEAKAAADRRLDDAGLWPRFTDLLRDVTVVDPACGSGAFLVGMLNVMNDLTERADSHLGVTRSGFDRKKRIIGQNLYGVDVMEWACHVAELRLWLSLIVDAEFTREELHDRREPLLPHFTFKIRCGDSLVQEVGGINLSQARDEAHILPPIRERISELKMRKLRFYSNDPGGEGDSVELIEEEERQLFCSILDDQRDDVLRRIAQTRENLESPLQRQLTLDGSLAPESRQMSLRLSEWEQDLDSLESALETIKQMRKAIVGKERLPFVWDIAFVEIFEGGKNGFDIVIGNPPYVRQENIADPLLTRDRATPESKREYKAKLASSVYRAFPTYFGYHPGTGSTLRTLDKQSDLYVYFYFKGLSLLNSKGSFCFVTSNSWLDVAYGADLQEFLLRHCHVKMVLDNLVRRSFASANINTVIVLFSAPYESRETGLDHVARFVMFKIPFEQMLLSVPAIAFQDVESAGQISITPDYRIRSLPQSQLLREGHKQTESKRPVYQGSKWGGKLLRAPDVYWSIRQQGAAKLVRLGDLADIRRGLTTGANDFFYVRVLDTHNGIARIMCDDGTEHTIESEYVREPALVKTREIVRPLVSASDLEYRLVILDEKGASKPHAARYIRWGESKGFHLRPTTKSRRPWWAIRVQHHAAIAFPMAHKRRPVLALLKGAPIHLDNRLYAVYPKRPGDALLIAAGLCSTFGVLSREIHGRANFGQGMLDMKVYEVGNLEVLDPSLLSNDAKQALLMAYDSISRRRILMLYDGVRLPDRQALDSAFLLALGFSDPAERAVICADLQDAACRMIWNRLAKSDNARETRMSYDTWKDSGQPFDSQAGEDDGDA